MKYKLSQLMAIIGGGTPKTTNSEYWGGTIPWLSVKDFNNDKRYVYTTEKTITEKGLFNSSTTLLQKNDIIISARGTVGEMASIPFPMAFNQSCYGLRANESIIDTDYLYYLVKLKVVELKHNSHGSVFDTITRDTFNGIEVDIPSKPTQRQIGRLLSKLDEKIELNDKINNNLQQQAQAIYYDLFSTNCCDDWEQGVLSNIAEITMGQSPSGDSYNENRTGTVFFQGRAEFGTRFPTIRLYTTEPKRLARENDILMSVRAPVGDLNIAHEDCCIGRGLAAIRSKTGQQSFLLYSLLSLRPQLNVFNGEGTVFGSINRDSLNKLPLTIPDKEAITRFESIVAPMDAIIRANHDENCRLAGIRDSLLPRLMSGEIDVSDVEF